MDTSEGQGYNNSTSAAGTIQILNNRKESVSFTLNETRQSISEMKVKLLDTSTKLKDACIRAERLETSLRSRKFAVGVACVKVKALLDSCGKLEADIENGSSSLDKARQELSRESDNLLAYSTEFGRLWNTTPTGKETRKLEAAYILKEVSSAKLQLQQDLKEFLENEKIYEDALRQKSELEGSIVNERTLLRERELQLHAEIEAEKINLDDLTRKREEFTSKYLKEKDRLDKRIKQARNSIERVKSRNSREHHETYNQQLALSLNRNSVVASCAALDYSSSLCQPIQYLGLPASGQPPAEKYRCTEIGNIKKEVDATVSTRKDAPILVPVPTQSRNSKFLFKKKSISTAASPKHGAQQMDNYC